MSPSTEAVQHTSSLERNFENQHQSRSSRAPEQSAFTRIRERKPYGYIRKGQEIGKEDEEGTFEPEPSMSRQNTGQGRTPIIPEAQLQMDAQPSSVRACHVGIGQNNMADFVGQSVDVRDFEVKSNNEFLAGRRSTRLDR